MLGADVSGWAMKHPIDWTEGGDWRFAPPPAEVVRWFAESKPDRSWTARWDDVRGIKATATCRVLPPQPMPYRAGDEILTVSNDDGEAWRYVLAWGFPDGRREWAAQVRRWPMNRAAQVLVREPVHVHRKHRPPWREGLPQVLPLVVLRGPASWFRCGARWIDRDARRPFRWTALVARREVARERRWSVRNGARLRERDGARRGA